MRSQPIQLIPYRSSAMNRLCVLFIACLLAVPCFALAAVSPGTQVVLAPREEVPTYKNLAAAQKKKDPEMVEGAREADRANAWNQEYKVLEEKSGWLRLEDSDQNTFWVAADKAMPTDAFLKNPAFSDITQCEADRPARFVVTLDKEHPNAVVRMIKKPDVNGGHAEMEVWDSAEKTLLWSTEGEANKAAEQPIEFTCYRAAERSWPTILGDINGDGKAEILYRSMLSSAAYSSQPFPSFILLAWDGKAFVQRNTFMLALNAETMPESGPLLEEGYPGGVEEPKSRIYLSELLAARDDGWFTATMVQEYVTSEQDEKTGTAILRLGPDGKSFVFKGWDSPLK